ncbi:MAG: hypothetical protein JXN59_05450 [Anaerolineae bacterium]|nr:hypothetical protein [Anaerolineae bacterium]
MEPILPAFLLEPNLLYLMLVVAAWVAVLALFVPGTGVIEFAAAVGLLLGLGGLAYLGAGWLGLVLGMVAFGLYALAILRQFAGTRDIAKLPPVPQPMIVAGVATLVQVISGLLIMTALPALAWWLVILLALGSLAVYRWMLLPTLGALRPPPQAGVEALIGEIAEVRSAHTGSRPATVYLNGELWQVEADEALAPGDRVEVMAREGMRLIVQKTVGRGE